MQKQHDDALTRRFETILDTGMVFIHWSEIRRWYDIQRVSKATFRDMLMRWNELTNSKQGELMCVRGPANEGMWLYAEKSSEKVENL